MRRDFGKRVRNTFLLQQMDLFLLQVVRRVRMLHVR